MVANTVVTPAVSELWPALTSKPGVWQAPSIAERRILFGLGAITYALHPEGVVEWQKRRVVETVVSWRKHAEMVG